MRKYEFTGTVYHGFLTKQSAHSISVISRERISCVDSSEWLNVLFVLEAAGDTYTSVNATYELSDEMDSISSRGQPINATKKDVASTYFDQRITIPRDKDDVGTCICIQ